MNVRIEDIIVRLADRMAFIDESMTTTIKDVRALLDDIEKEGER